MTGVALTLLCVSQSFAETVSDPRSDVALVAPSEVRNFDADQIDPLIDLARTQTLEGNANEAEESLKLAQHIIHRNEGVHSLRQIEVLDLMTEIYVSLDKIENADQQQQLSAYISERSLGEDSLALLPSLERMGRWYADTGQFANARKSLERITDIIEQQGEDQDVRLIAPLMELARLQRMQRICCSYRPLEQASDIVENHPELPGDERAAVYSALGDAYLASGKKSRAGEAYRQSWEALDPNMAAAQFEQPVQIAMAEVLPDNDHPSRRVYKIERDAFGYARYRQVSRSEQMNMTSYTPQLFLVPLTDTARPFHLTEPLSHVNRDEEKVRAMVGQPFQFVLRQLRKIMPVSASNADKLAKLEVEMQFTVTPDGRASDVRIIGEAPHRLKRLLRKAMYKAYFRPRIVDGEPVATENVTLTQTFH